MRFIYSLVSSRGPQSGSGSILYRRPLSDRCIRSDANYKKKKTKCRCRHTITASHYVNGTHAQVSRLSTITKTAALSSAHPRKPRPPRCNRPRPLSPLFRSPPPARTRLCMRVCQMSNFIRLLTFHYLSPAFWTPAFVRGPTLAMTRFHCVKELSSRALSGDGDCFTVVKPRAI